MALTDQNIVVLVGGVGGAKLAYGLAQIISPERLTVIVNVADDFWHYGLRICPDSDTIMYTLAGLVDAANGWGVADDTAQMLHMLRRYGEDAWFRLGDRDLATHLLRTQLLHEGQRLTQVTQHLTHQLSIGCAVLPVSDQTVATIVNTVEYGELEFQTYFVKHRWQPQVRSITYQGAAEANVTLEVQQAIKHADAILFGPSNPWLSIEPILAVGEMRELLRSRAVPRIALTPIVGGNAVKGPAAKIMRELGYEVSAETVAALYGDVINGFLSDERDAPLNSPNLRTAKFDTMMLNDQDKLRVAQQVLTVLERWHT